MIRSQGVSSFPFVLFSKTSAPWRAWLSICLACNASDCRGTACDAARQRTRHDETRDRFSSLSQMKTDFLNFFKIHSSFSLPCDLFSAFQFLKAQASSDWEIFCISNSWTCLKICWGPRLERRLGGPSNCLQQRKLNVIRFSGVASLGSCQPPILALA